MACPTGKIEHPTREAALAAQHKLVYDNHVRGRDERSRDLNVYPCEYECGGWHVGHRPHWTPSAFHYTSISSVHNIVAADALVPPKPIRVSKRARRQSSGALLASLLEIEEMAAMTWFTWDGAWDFSRAPHPGVFLNLEPAERLREGVLRVEVPSSFAKLRWPDYVECNKVTRRRRRYFTESGNPAQWLATDKSVPRDRIRSMDAWLDGVWTPTAPFLEQRQSQHVPRS